ncbi:Two-component system sensor histidine kinase [Bacteroides ovatus]|jgi:ATPase/histidine kinase/DNA gyrase B/HSP90 domain protein|uniref:sensor histidine kinase n=1 Tax=Bacteroides TaxID=816 RepID=UPI000E89BB73|nr:MULTISPECIES: HAMP domain-containing sensor histidine kinase [Bacteroides]MCS3179136.1 HAMP domain-containing histidine kinase [Candidatus Bacteroides intestinigallinarum]RGN65300.1 sensor histidine kinase [Bacteroides sp. OM05-10AA]RGQ69528.1 sensor histidine kinase [Bacteroides sp. AF27-33]CAG9893710.1 Two-component system sensor histidine kinase [Bacteroides ovatus]
MDKTYFKSKYVLIFILSLFVFIGGLNYKHWLVTNKLTPKRISLIYSMTKNDIGNKKLEKLLYEEFHRQGIEAIFDKFYIDCTKLNEKEEIEYARRYLELLESKSTDLILTIGDQATYSFLSTRHRLLSSIPVLACNVRFPNEELIEEYDLQKVYVLRDSPDLKRNIDFIKTLYPHNMEIIYNIDLTYLGHQSFDKLSKVVDRQSVRVLGYQKAFVQESDYEHLTEMIEYFNLTPGLVNDRVKRSGLTISLCPFRYIRGASLLVMLEQSKREQKNQAFLLDKLDMMAIPIVTALNIPSFSCICEGFGENAKIVGGYMATESISAKAIADLATRLLKKEKVGMPKIRDLEKEYVLDWIYFSEFAGDISNVPKDVSIINYPFYDRYRKELYILGGLFVISFILVTISLLRTHRRSLIERRNLQMLQEVHKRLSLSVDGGKISLWNIQEGILEFDDNYTQLVGLEQRRFTKEDMIQYTHPDDVQLLSSFYETLHQSPGMQIQRIRFCFGKEGADYEWYELRCSSLKDARGEIMLAGTMQNIQKLVEHEHQLILAKQIAEKAELKQSFLNNMSHEIRTPLNAIVGFTNLLIAEGADEIEPEEKATMLEIINTNNELLLKLVNDVLEISRLDSGNLSFDIKECDITKIVKEIYMTYQTLIQPSLNFLLELDETVSLPANIDSLRFTQVISNFLNNANKFTKEGTITLGGKIDKEHREVCVYVKDTGKGIDDKELMMIFDRFYKTDEFEQGSGLGLSISKVIIERLAGRIEVDSEVGKGSCFSVVLSLASTI